MSEKVVPGAYTLRQSRRVVVIGSGAVCSAIVVGRWGTRQGAPVGSLHIAQGAVGGTHAGGTAASGTTVSADPGAATLDLVCPAVGAGAVCHGKAGDGELNAVDGGGGHRVRGVN